VGEAGAMGCSHMQRLQQACRTTHRWLEPAAFQAHSAPHRLPLVSNELLKLSMAVGRKHRRVGCWRGPLGSNFGLPSGGRGEREQASGVLVRASVCERTQMTGGRDLLVLEIGVGVFVRWRG
jgi:hypothetical protein